MATEKKAYEPTAYDRALDAMLEAGISRGRADELLLAVCDLAVTNHEIERQMVVRKAGEVLARELEVGDIVEERHSASHVIRKIVVKMTDKSAVFRTEYGQDGRTAFTRKQKGKVVEQTVQRVGHIGLTEDTLRMLGRYYFIGDLKRARWERGLLPDVPPFYSLFGYEQDQTQDKGTQRWEHEGEKVTVLSDKATGDVVEIRRDPKGNTYVQGTAVPVTTWGAYAVDPEHGHLFACLGWRYRDRDAAEKAAKIFFGTRHQGVSLEESAHLACHVGNEHLPLVDRWKESA